MVSLAKNGHISNYSITLFLSVQTVRKSLEPINSTTAASETAAISFNTIEYMAKGALSDIKVYTYVNKNTLKRSFFSTTHKTSFQFRGLKMLFFKKKLEKGGFCF